jgi:hypothetical protein
VRVRTFGLHAAHRAEGVVMHVIAHCWVIERDKQTGDPIVTGGPDDGEHGIPPEPGYVEVVPLAAYRGAVAERDNLRALLAERLGGPDGGRPADTAWLEDWLARARAAVRGQ